MTSSWGHVTCSAGGLDGSGAVMSSLARAMLALQAARARRL
jgi:hypothetical protein